VQLKGLKRSFLGCRLQQNSMKLLTRFKFFLWGFGRFKVPMIGILKPRIISLDDKTIVIKLPLTRKSKNHLNSMYFGALAVGADVAGGLHGFYHAKKSHVSISLAFKSFQAQFLRRPESDVFFVSHMGNEVKEMVLQSQQSGERVNQLIQITAYVNYPAQAEEVAKFTLELSLKVK
jgi:acyl-coenzyme A thioesterase PaaI-like protein